MAFTNEEKCGIVDLLQSEETNIPVLIQLAKSVTKNVVDIATTQEALDYIFTHVPDCLSLLSKRAITKEVLFKYLHSKKVAVTTDITKALLVSKILEYWRNTMPKEQDEKQPSPQENHNNTPFNYRNLDRPTTTLSVKEMMSTSPQAWSESRRRPTESTSLTEESEFPINLLARKFSEWFFNNYNRDLLKLQDFWPDARLSVLISANDGIDQNDCDDSSSLLQTLYDTRQRFGFFFNPNLTHAGVQGRMDVHGLVLVLACGTLHTETDCVGLFECTFGLLRDPYSDNNWKTKTVKLMLRSKGAPSIPCLEDSDTLKEALTLPVPQGEIA